MAAGSEFLAQPSLTAIPEHLAGRHLSPGLPPQSACGCKASSLPGFSPGVCREPEELLRQFQAPARTLAVLALGDVDAGRWWTVLVKNWSEGRAAHWEGDHWLQVALYPNPAPPGPTLALWLSL